MIKIEISDLANENKIVLMKIAELLMHISGHQIIKVPEDTGLQFPKESKAVDAWAPYQHCAESDLTTYRPDAVKAAIDIDTKIGMEVMREMAEGDKQFKGVKAYTIDGCIQDTVNEHVKHILEDYASPTFTDLFKNEDDGVGELNAARTELIKSIVAKRAIDVLEEPKKPKRAKKTEEVPPPPPLESEVPPPPFQSDMPIAVGDRDEINTAMKLITKMTELVQSKRISQAQLLNVIKDAGLNEVIDVCQHEELVGSINTALDKLL